MTSRGNVGNGISRGTGPAALGIALALVTGGCATAREYKPDREPYVFTIAFDDRCPVAATADLRNCDGKPADCVRVRGGQSVRFESSPAGRDFLLQFDPFGRSSIASVNGTLSLPTQRHAKDAAKPYTFGVLSTSPGCAPVDPQIIVDR